MSNDLLDCKEAKSISPPHMTFYALQLEPSTKLHKMVTDGHLDMPTDEESAQMYLEAHQTLEETYEHYEPSHYARRCSERDYKGRHNVNYWSGHDYIGIGPGAVGRYSDGDHRVRYQNVSVA
jgi:coproporphyrinogen III oxidase-like Fe-S oxidoreductase